MSDLSFNVMKDGKKVICDIIALIPGDDNETYIAFTDYLKKEGEDSIQYAKIVQDKEKYYIEEFDDDIIIDKLKEKISDNFIKSVMEEEI